MQGAVFRVEGVGCRVSPGALEEGVPVAEREEVPLHVEEEPVWLRLQVVVWSLVFQCGLGFGATAL